MIYRLTIIVGIIFLFTNFWLYSRFTVDDAFISWRYGKNLIDYGIWNYNPSPIDLTQSYTNPIYAFLSVIPNFFRLDIVFFFKIFSFLNFLIFALWYLKNTNKSFVTLLLLIGLPATIIHAFSGLETFLYVSLISVLYVALDKNKKFASIGISLILFLVRPESWLLALLLPFFFLIKDDENLNKIQFFQISTISKLKNLKLDFFSAIICAISLVFPLLLYLFLNKIYFGYPLPNTFYFKSISYFSINEFIKLTFLILPLLILIKYVYQKNKIFLFIFTYSFILILYYSMAKLSMNYMDRFTYHIFFPVYVFVIYSSTKKNLFKKKFINNFALNFKFNNFTKTIAIIFLLFFFKISGIKDAHLVTYYPRILDSHAILGKTLSKIKEKHKIDSFIFGDAGIAAYHSKLQALDNIGIGSALVTHYGFNEAVIDKYKPQLIVFHATPNEIRFDKKLNQDKMIKWAETNGFDYICDVYWQSWYTLKIYSLISDPELKKICEISKKKNNNNNFEYLKETFTIAPWKYWKE